MSGPPVPQREYLDVNGVAALLGRTPKAIRGLVKRRQIPHLCIGRSLYFRVDTIHRWMSRYRRNGAYIEPPVRVQRGLPTTLTPTEIIERIQPLVDECGVV